MRLWMLPVGVVLAVLTWHVPWVMPQAGIDDSWAIALTMAASHGLDFGRDVVFTYGPLGFLSVPRVDARVLAVVGWLFDAGTQIGLAVAVVAVATRVYGVLVGVVLAYLALGLTLLPSDMLVYLTFAGVAWVLERDDPPRARWLVPAAGVVAAVQLLIKLNGGILCLVLAALAVWRLAPGRWRSELELAASFVVSGLVLWVAAGNSLSALPDWLRHSRHVVSAYSDAMALDPGGRTAEGISAAVLIAAVGALLALQLRRLPRARAATLALAAAAFVYAYLKEGFVRQDAHVLDFFGALAVAILVFRWREPLRWPAALAVAGCAVAMVLTPDVAFRHLYDAQAAVRAVGTQLRDLVSPNLGAARARTQAALGLPTRDVALLRGHTVDSVPYETSAVWAYDLRWRPEPLLQWYMAYDAHLDSLNAAALHRRGAERILRQHVVGADATIPELQAPATYLTTLCDYREIAANGTWEVLARTRDRCGQPRVLSTVQAHAGEAIHVPSARVGEIVVAHVHVPEPFGAKLESALLKPFAIPRILLGGIHYRIVPAVASGPLVLRLPAAAGRSPFFGGYTSYDTVAFEHVASPLRVEFDAVPVRAERSVVAVQQPPPGVLSSTGLEVGGRRFRIAPAAFEGWVDVAQPVGGLGALAGWAVASATHRPAGLVAAFAGARLVGLVRPGEPRQDVASGFHTKAARDSGYSLVVRVPPDAALRVFALGAGRATELNYPAGYPWPRR